MYQYFKQQKLYDIHSIAIVLSFIYIYNSCAFPYTKLTVLLKINNVQFQSSILKYANLDPHLDPGHVSPRKVTAKSAQHFARSITKKGTEPAPVYLQIAIKENVLTSNMLLILSNTRIYTSDSDLKGSVDLISGEWLRTVEENCPKAGKLTIKHLSITCMKYEGLSQKH